MKNNTFLRFNSLRKTTYVVFFLFSATAFAQQTFHDPATYSGRGLGSQGWVNVQTPTGGLYVYGPEPESKERVKPFVIGRVQRSDYEFFSAEEEEALWKLRQEQITAQEVEIQRERSRLRRLATKQKHPIAWPKVVVRGNDVCVPSLENSDSADWRDHLICTEVKWDE